MYIYIYIYIYISNPDNSKEYICDLIHICIINDTKNMNYCINIFG